jgi:D-alanyl-D-alanine dipeptidase
MVPRIVVRLAAAALGLMLVMAAKPVKSAVATSAPSPTTAPAAVRPPAEAGPFRPSDLVELAQIDPTMKLDIRYARPDNFTGKAVYAQARAFLQRKAAEALVRVQRSLRERGYGLIIFDGYRPWSVTRRFWDLTPADKKVFVADPAKGSRHNRGAAVDVSLYDLASGREVAMPSAYDDFSEKAFATYTGGGAESRAHRGLLRDAMEREGFFVYPEEWWHFDYKDWRDYPILDVPLEDLPAMALSAGVPDTIEWSRAELVDLTWTFDQTTLYWPTSPTHFELQRLAHGPTQAGYFYSANSFCAPEHGGTHLDAPVHFAEKGDTADQVPLGRLVAPGLVIDISPQAAVDADYRLRREDVLAWEKKHGRIPDGSIVLLRTGWGTRWPDRARVFGDATPNEPRLRAVQDFRRPRPGDGGERAGPGERRPPGTSAGNRRSHRRPADEDRRRLRRAVAYRRDPSGRSGARRRRGPLRRLCEKRLSGLEPYVWVPEGHWKNWPLEKMMSQSKSLVGPPFTRLGLPSLARLARVYSAPSVVSPEKTHP